MLLRLKPRGAQEARGRLSPLDCGGDAAQISQADIEHYKSLAAETLAKLRKLKK